VAQNLVKDGVAAEVIHGNKAQNARQRALNAFRGGQVRVLVATDIVARGIDVPGVTHVVNYDLPDEPEAYVHRIGRTGRNGADGIAITLCAPDELKKLRAVEKLTRTTLLPGGPSERAAPQPKGQQPKKPRPPRKAGPRKAGEVKGAKLAAREPAAAPEKPLDPVRAQRARNRRPRRTQRAA
jgi:ATP-dependent RNA helicase RhlE